MNEKGIDLAAKVDRMERDASDNLYSRVKKTRLTRKERDSMITSYLHEDLLDNERVTIEKYSNNNFKRGLQEDEEPFPVISKVGPYVVSACF